ncbi:group III truncated hemoglobin [Kordia algicida OT-1]|uniref:SEC-independent protein translocase protein TatC n=1 Tax=Kordia algicida OT-1 TaxID=391587 RepID=A9E7W3_9FLAO|nr:group III truncated hemoglobin [Kordia algicida]EDP94939.1 SEC-independent protein translocase protein TatC [Kordia algicida OT-1]
MKKDIQNRADVHLLVTTFYAKIRKDEILGPIFNNRIQHWDAHLEHLTDFWESSLFFVNKYKGNPLEKHIEVDAAIHHIINEKHFGIWLNHWIQTLDALFEGDKTSIAKNRARKMGTFIYIKLFEARTAK